MRYLTKLNSPDHAILLLYSLMGLQTSVNAANASVGRLGSFSEIGRQYQNKLFMKNKKSSQKFREEVESICKRSAYLNYPWAKQLFVLFKQKSGEQLYSQYKSVLKQNCIREGHKEKIFCPAKIRKIFMSTFTTKYEKTSQIQSPKELLKVFDECKTYFMVMAWLHQLVSLNQDQENQDNVSQEWSDFEQEQIYQILVRLCMETYGKFMKDKQTVAYQKQNSIIQNYDLLKLLKILEHKSRFNERETVISKIQTNLMHDQMNLNANLKQIEEFVGNARLFAHLMTIREVGRISINFLWRHFGAKPHKILFQ